VTWRRLLLFDLLLLSFLILGSRMALLIHEGGGHALPVKAFGASEARIRMSPLGGGYVSWRFPPGRAPSPAQTAVIKLGGIALNLLTGAAAWWAARRRRSLGLLLFGAGSVGGALAYLSNGLYYGSGDPTGLAPTTLDIAGLQPLWVLGPPALAVVVGLAARHWADLLDGHVPTSSWRGRIGWTLATLGVAGAAYGGLWSLLRDGRVEGSTRQWRLEAEVAKEVERQAATSPAPVVRAEDVAHRVPSPLGPVVLFGAAALAGVAGLRPPARPVEPRAEPAWAAGAWGAAAAGTVALLKLFG
jgi:hypothetical protein